MSNVKPGNANNAIKVVAYALDFVHEIDESTIKSAISLYNEDDSLNQDLTRVQPQESISIQINNGVQLQQQTLGGVAFERISDKATVEWSLQLRKQSLSVTCTNYTKWENIWTKAQEYLSKLLPLLSDVEVASTTLEYVDEFIINDISSPWKEELFKRDSTYLTGNIFDTKSFWHSHHGYFSECSCGNVEKVLNTVNIEYVEEQKKINKIIIRSQHKSLIQGIFIKDDFFNTVLNESIESNHKANKNILINLLSDSMLKEIDLQG